MLGVGAEAERGHRGITFGVILGRPGVSARFWDAFGECYRHDRAPFAVANGTNWDN